MEYWVRSLTKGYTCMKMFFTVSPHMQNRCSTRRKKEKKKKNLTGKRIPGSKTKEYFFTVYFLENTFQPYLLFTPALMNLSPVSSTFL